MNNIESPHKYYGYDKSGHRPQANKLLNAMGNRDKFFNYYKIFDEKLVEKTNKILSYSGYASLGYDGLETEEIYPKFFNAFIQSIKGIVGEDLFYRLSIQPTEGDTDEWGYRSSEGFCSKPYLLLSREMVFLDHYLQCVTFGDTTIAQFYRRRTGLNNVEYTYTIYPDLMFKLINKSLKEKNIKEIEFFSNNNDNSTEAGQSTGKFNDFFGSYKNFEKYLVEKSDNIISYLGCIEEGKSEKLHSEFYDAFIQSIKGIVGENYFNSFKNVIENNTEDYILSNYRKQDDDNPALDDKFKSIIYKEKIIAQFYHRKKAPNNVEFCYTIYPKKIFEIVNDLNNR